MKKKRCSKAPAKKPACAELPKLQARNLRHRIHSDSTTPLQIKHRASQVNSALAWHCVVEALVSALLVPMFMMISRLFFALALCCCVVAPALGLAAARWSKWWLALPHCIAAAGVIALRSYVPLQTVNWLVVSSAVVAALSALHQLNLGFRWFVFTVRHGKMLQRKKREEDGDTAREENRRRDNSTRGREEDVPMGVPLDCLLYTSPSPRD